MQIFPRLSELSEIDTEGLHKSPEKIKALKEEKCQENVSELRSFVGLVNNYHRFIDSLSSVAGPLHTLLKKDIKWKGNSNREGIFSKHQRPDLR